MLSLLPQNLVILSIHLYTLRLLVKLQKNELGAFSEIPEKYMAYHKISLRPSWGEIAFVEQVIYSNRNTDLAYLNPIGFLKSIRARIARS